MIINRMSDEQNVPDWTLSLKKVATKDAESVAIESGRDLPVELSGDKIVSERDEIEKCASDNSRYCYSSEWAKRDVSALKEYALACGLPLENFSEVTPKEEIAQEIITASTSGITRTASVEDKPATLDIGDAFGLADIEDSPVAEVWEDIKPETKLASRPSMMTGAVKPIGGGEDYLANSNVPLASNQNSILNPNAIETLAGSETEDTGERLAREAAEKKASKEQEHVDWQQTLVDSMPDFHDVIKGNVFPTEVMNAQSGLRSPSSQMGVYADFDKDSIPEKTVGETLAAQNEARRQTIQGSDKEDHEFKMSSQSGRSISDPFIDALKTALNK